VGARLASRGVVFSSITCCPGGDTRRSPKPATFRAFPVTCHLQLTTPLGPQSLVLRVAFLCPNVEKILGHKNNLHLLVKVAGSGIEFLITRAVLSSLRWRIRSKRCEFKPKIKAVSIRSRRSANSLSVRKGMQCRFRIVSRGQEPRRQRTYQQDA
jgi:hypothetical protein